MAAAPPIPAHTLGKIIRDNSPYPDERPETGDLVRIHYVGRLDDGTIFDSSRARQKVFEFNIGEAQVIDGWDMLIGTMALGERADLVIPPEFGYGEEGFPPYIPPGATLTYDVELLDIGKPMEEDTEGVAEADGEEAEDAPEAAPEPFWSKDPEREGGQCPGFTWQATGTGAEIVISLPMSSDVKVKEIQLDVKTHQIACKIQGETVLEGELFAGVDSDECHWDIERVDKGSDIQLLVSLAKLDRYLKWESLFKGGDPEIPQTVEADTEVIDAEVIDVDAAMRMANETVRRRTDAKLK